MPKYTISSKEIVMDLIETLRTALATTFAIYFKTHSYHWNVIGPAFPHLHNLFKEQYEDLWASVDDYAEQIRQQDAFAPVSIAEMMSNSQIEEDTELTDARQMLRNLIADHEAAIMVLNAAAVAAKEMEDEAVVNFIGERLAAHSKMRWMLKATAT